MGGGIGLGDCTVWTVCTEIRCTVVTIKYVHERAYTVAALIPRSFGRGSLLVELTADDTGDEAGGVRVGEEVGRVRLDLLDGEAGAGVGAVGEDAGQEGADLAAHGDLVDLGAGACRLRVGEGDARGTRLALVGLVDVCGGQGGGLVGAGDAFEGDVLLCVSERWDGQGGGLTQQIRFISDWMP